MRDHQGGDPRTGRRPGRAPGRDLLRGAPGGIAAVVVAAGALMATGLIISALALWLG